MKQGRSTRRLLTLGTLGVDGSDYARTKPLTLLAHLCLEGPQPRRRLASLFWPGAADPLNQLSLTLSRLGKDLPGACHADAKSVEARIDCDAALLRASLAEGSVERASSLYGGEFLHGLTVHAISAELREWIEDMRDDLARSLQHALLHQAAHVARAGSRERAAKLVRRAVKVRDVSLLDADDLLFAHDALLWARDPAAQRFRVEAEDLGLEFQPGVSAAEARLHGSHARSPRTAPRPGRTEDARTRLIGRRAELELLCDLLVVDRHRLVTITGPGGIGKSLLATAAADVALASGAFPSGLAHVSCDGLKSPSDVARAAIEALGATPPATGVGPEHLTAELVHRTGTLLFLDDFDHQSDHAGWLPELLRTALGTTVLVAANQPVGSANERVLPLSGLSTTGPLAGEVGALFLERARRADASYELTTADVPFVVELGRLTGGNPLAIELAAAWAAVVPVAEIVHELADGLEMLATEAHDAPSRHRSLLAVFQHSWELLDDADRRQLQQLSVLRGSFDRVTAAAVAGASLPDLARLCRKSMLARPTPGRFECQHLFRHWLAEHWGENAGARAAARERHATHFLTVARAAGRTFDSADCGQSFARLDLERRDLIAAIEWFWSTGDQPRLLSMLRSLGPYWIRRGHLDAVFPWYERVATSEAAPGSEEDRATVLRQYAYSLALVGDLDRPRHLLERALSVAHEAGSVPGEARVANALGVLAVFRRELEAATAWYEHAELLARQADAEDLIPFIINNLGDVHAFSGRFDLAEACYREAITRVRALGNLQMHSNVLGALGSLEVRQGRLPEAAVALRESVCIVRDLGITFSVPTALDQYAALFTARGDVATAARLWGAADALRRKLGTEILWFEAEERSHWQEQAARTLASRALSALFEEGAALTPEAALELALADEGTTARTVRATRRPEFGESAGAVPGMV